jgi:hypothetical protein
LDARRPRPRHVDLMTDADRRAAATAELEATKAVVAQAVARIINAGDLDAADELYAPGIAASRVDL